MSTIKEDIQKKIISEDTPPKGTGEDKKETSFDPFWKDAVKSIAGGLVLSIVNDNLKIFTLYGRYLSLIIFISFLIGFFSYQAKRKMFSYVFLFIMFVGIIFFSLTWLHNPADVLSESIVTPSLSQNTTVIQNYGASLLPYSPFNMTLNLTMKDDTFSGTLEEPPSTIAIINGQTGSLSSFNLSDQQRLNTVVQKYGAGTGIFVVFTDPSIVQGPIAPNCNYCAVLKADGSLQGIWFYQWSTSSGGDGTFTLTPVSNKTQTATKLSNGIWQGQGQYYAVSQIQNSANAQKGVCYYDWKGESVTKIGDFTAPQNHTYFIVTVYMKSDADTFLRTDPSLWILKLRGIDYSCDPSISRVLNNHDYRDPYPTVGQGEESEFKIVYLDKGFTLSKAEIHYAIGSSVEMKRIKHY